MKISKSIIYASLFAFFIGVLFPITSLHGDSAAPIAELIRNNNGQNIYLDYLLPFGPFSLIFSKLLNIHNHEYLISIILSGLSNFLYFTCIYKICFKFSNENEISIMSALISAIWFTPMVDGYYYDNTAILLGMMAFLALNVYKENVIGYAISGLLCGLSVLVKQNTGIAIGFPLVLYIIFCKEFVGFKKLYFFAFGGFLAILMAGIYLYAIGGLSGFYNVFVENAIRYGRNSERGNYNSIINNIIFPYQQNYFKIVISTGVLLFIPMVILQYALYVETLKANRKILNFYIFIITGSILTQLLVGRGILNLCYFAGLQFFVVTCYPRVNRTRKLIFLLLFGIGVLFAFKDFVVNYYGKKNVFINSVYYNEQHKCSMSIDELLKFSNKYPDKFNVSFIGFSDSNLLPIVLNKFPVNYLIFYNTFIYDKNRDEEWQDLEIKNIKKFKPKIIIMPKNSCKTMGDISLIQRYLDSNYIISDIFDKYYIYEPKSNI